MGDQDWLAEQFEANRGHLRAVAYRMLGSSSEAEDVVQEAWLRLSRSDVGGVENLGGWLTTVVARVSLDALRSRKANREDAFGAQLPDSIAGDADGSDPEHAALLADSVGPALLVILETLAPAERLAFVLHDMFGMSFDEIAPIVDRTPTAARQLASRARRRVRGADIPDPDYTRQREVVDAFLAASRDGDFAALLSLLDPDVVLKADELAVQVSTARQARGAPKLATRIHGAAAVAEVFSGRARVAQPARVDGAAGAAWAQAGTPRAVFAFEIVDRRIVGIEIVYDPARLDELDVELLDD